MRRERTLDTLEEATSSMLKRSRKARTFRKRGMEWAMTMKMMRTLISLRPTSRRKRRRDRKS